MKVKAVMRQSPDSSWYSAEFYIKLLTLKSRKPVYLITHSELINTEIYKYNTGNDPSG